MGKKEAERGGEGRERGERTVRGEGGREGEKERRDGGEERREGERGKREEIKGAQQKSTE